MKKELDELLCKRYPKIFRDRNADMRTTAMCWGFECGSGWFHIIDNLCWHIQSHIDCNRYPPKDIPQVVASQVKEKFGGLRFYYAGGDDEIAGAISFAETLAGSTCEECGSTKNIGVTSGWISTICQKCAEESFKSMSNWTSLEDLRKEEEDGMGD